jgi:hypothetical protein
MGIWREYPLINPTTNETHVQSFAQFIRCCKFLIAPVWMSVINAKIDENCTELLCHVSIWSGYLAILSLLPELTLRAMHTWRRFCLPFQRLSRPRAFNAHSRRKQRFFMNHGVIGGLNNTELSRAVARRDNWGRGGGGYIHIFMFTYRKNNGF